MFSDFPYLVYSSQPSGNSKTRPREAPAPAPEPEVHSGRRGEDQQREEGAPADHLQPHQDARRGGAPQVERGNRSGQSQRESQCASCSHVWTVEQLLVYNEHSAPAPLSDPPALLFLPLQEEAKLFEYHKLARKLQLIPLSAKNARGHDFEIRQFNCGSGSLLQHNTETQVRVVCSSKDLVAGKSSYWVHVLCCRCAWESSSATWRRRTVS